MTVSHVVPLRVLVKMGWGKGSLTHLLPALRTQSHKYGLCQSPSVSILINKSYRF